MVLWQPPWRCAYTRCWHCARLGHIRAQSHRIKWYLRLDGQLHDIRQKARLREREQVIEHEHCQTARGELTRGVDAQSIGFRVSSSHRRARTRSLIGFRVSSSNRRTVTLDVLGGHVQRLAVHGPQLALAQPPAPEEGSVWRDGVGVAQLEQHAAPSIERQPSDREGSVVPPAFELRRILEPLQEEPLRLLVDQVLKLETITRERVVVVKSDDIYLIQAQLAIAEHLLVEPQLPAGCTILGRRRQQRLRVIFQDVSYRSGERRACEKA